ncbi:DnaB-like helicase C-terminal domain-containing protein [Neobacillus niacini]
MAQLNRSVESSVNKRSMISDIRESGSVERGADVILFLFL